MSAERVERADHSGLSAPAYWSLALIGFGFLPLLATFFINLWKQPEYQFFPQALAAAGFLAWDRLREVPRPMSAGRHAPGALLLLASFLLLGLAVLIWSPLLAMLAALPAAVALLWKIGGPLLVRKMCPALLMVAVIVPPPLGLDLRLGLFLREVATKLSSRTLDLMGVVHCVTGNVIEIPGQRLLVEEACSGINSVLFVTAFSLFFLLWRRRPFWMFLVCIPTALAFVVTGNVIRISLGAWLLSTSGVDILTGWKHEMQSVVLVALYVLLVISLENLFPATKEAPPSPGERVSPAARRPAAVWSWTAGFLFAALGLMSCVRAWEKSKPASGELRAATSALADGAVFSLPERIGDWRRSETGPPKISKIETIGLSSAIWNYQRAGEVAVVAFDYPIWRYHDVKGCYTGNGWVIERKDIVASKSGGPPRFQMDMRKEPGLHGLLWFATINEKGEWVDQATVRHDFLARIGLAEAPQETTFRVQLLLVGDHPPDAATIESADQLFEEASRLLSQQMLQQIRK